MYNSQIVLKRVFGCGEGFDLPCGALSAKQKQDGSEETETVASAINAGNAAAVSLLMMTGLLGICGYRQTRPFSACACC
jgi:hypothetical protein